MEYILIFRKLFFYWQRSSFREGKLVDRCGEGRAQGWGVGEEGGRDGCVGREGTFYSALVVVGEGCERVLCLGVEVLIRMGRFIEFQVNIQKRGLCIVYDYILVFLVTCGYQKKYYFCIKKLNIIICIFDVLRQCSWC